MLEEIVSISKLTFGSLIKEFKKFRVPSYQREYGWKESNWRDLSQTITELMEVNLEKRDQEMIEFVGDIILKKTDNKGVCEIIDGQQRLITISIFLSVIYKKLSDSEWKERKKEIREFLFYDLDEEQPRLSLNNEIDKKQYERILVCNVKGIEKEDEDLEKSWINEAEIWFEAEVTDNNLPSAKICEYINNMLYFALIIFSEETEPWDVFMALNNTGLNLNASNLAKSLLVSKIDPANTQQISDEWDKKIVAKITHFDNTKINTQMPKFLVDFWWAKFGKKGNTQTKKGVTVSKSSLYRVLKTKLGEFKSKKLKLDLFGELKKYADIYGKIIYPDEFKDWWEKNYSPEMFHIIYDINTLKFEQLFPLILCLHFNRKSEDGEEKLEKGVLIKELRKLLIYMFRVITLKGEYPRDISNKVTYQLIKNLKETARDYADNVIRHFRLTGLISFRGSARFIDISKENAEVVEGILNKFKLKWQKFSSEEDYINFLLSEIEIEWREERRDKKIMLLNFIESNKVTLDETRNELLWLIKKKSNSLVKVGKTFLRGLNDEETKSWWIRKTPPFLKLEFLLAILFFLKFGNAIKINPNLLLDDFGMPYHPAPAGKSDIEVIYNGHALLIEATLLVDKMGQSNSETSAVIRRGSDFQSKTKLITCSILVAPYIHFDTVLFFKTLLHNSFRPLKCNSFPVSIEKFVENFINSGEKIGVVVERKFLEFKNAEIDRLSEIVN